MRGRRPGRRTDHRSPVREVVADRACRTCNICERDQTLEAVMAGFVQEITDAHDTHGFADEVHREARTRASEDTHDGIEFLAAALQVRVGDYEIRRVQ